MRLVVLILVLSAFIALIANSGRTTYRWIRTFCKCVNPVAYGIVFGLVVAAILALFVLSRRPNIPIPRFLLQFSHCGVGAFVYLILFVNLASLLLYIAKLAKLIPSPQPAAVSISAFAVCAALIVGLTTYGMINAGSIDIVRYSIDLNSENASGFKIALISDLHLGHIVDEAHLEKVAAQINTMDADVVCIAGDIFDGDITALADRAAIRDAFRSIESKHGVFACLGNHDAGDSYDDMLALLKESDVQLLQDAYAVVDDRLILVGRRDSAPIGGHRGKRSEFSLPADNALPVVVLDHNPNHIEEYGSDVDLILCGHTHLGQMFPFNLVVKAIYDAPYGYYRADDGAPQVITTSGAGTWGPALRIGSDSEIAEITLE